MSRKTNKQVVESWSRGEAAASGNMSSDGENLLSYGLEIGSYKNREVYNYTSGGGNFMSMTTSHHVSLASRTANTFTLAPPPFLREK